MPSPKKTNAERERQLVEQLDRLQVHQRELQVADRILDSILVTREIASRTTEVDTASVGPFWVVATPNQLDEAVDAFTKAWEKLKGPLGEWSPPDGDRALVYHRTKDQYMLGSQFGVQARPWHPRARAESRALWALEKRIFHDEIPSRVRRWAPEAGLMDRRPLEYAYRNLIITASESARDCFEGDADRCWDALGLRNVESSWESWYDAAERRAAVANMNRLHASDYRCEDDNTQCLAYLKSVNELAPIPAEPLTRASFLGHALRVGGTGALGRLNEGDKNTPLIERFVHASGKSPDVLIASWRDEVLASAPPVQSTLSLKLLSGGLFWSLVFSGFAMRSTRWRA